MKEVGVVIVTYNSGEVIGRCLDACSGFDVAVVDNASEDATVAEVKRRPSIRLIENASNLGFAAAVNQGVGAFADKQFILLLNPDVQLTGTIELMVEACREPGIGIASGQLLDQNGASQTGFTIRRFPTPWALVLEVLGANRIWPRNPVNRRYRYLDADLQAPAEVEQPAGAFLLFRRNLWMELGGFDTRFHPLWFEDVDFCKRANALGWNARYVPGVTARHLGAHSIAKLPWARREVYWYVSLLRYASKHFRPLGFRGVSAAIVAGSVLRAGWGVLSRRSFKPVTVYAEIGQWAMLSLIHGRVLEPPAGSRPVTQ